MKDSSWIIARSGATIAVIAGTWSAKASGGLATTPTLTVTTLMTIVFTVLAGIRKFQGDLQRGWTRPEFYLAILQVCAVVGSTLIDAKAVPVRDVALVTAMVAAAYTLSRTLAKPAAAAPEPGSAMSGSLDGTVPALPNV